MAIKIASLAQIIGTKADAQGKCCMGGMGSVKKLCTGRMSKEDFALVAWARSIKKALVACPRFYLRVQVRMLENSNARDSQFFQVHVCA